MTDPLIQRGAPMRSRTVALAVSPLVLAVAITACTEGASTSSTASGPTAPSSATPSMSRSTASMSPSTAPPTAGDMATFTSISPAYSFRYPSSWKETEGASRTVPVTLRESAVTGGVSLTLDKVPPGTTLAAYGRGMQRRLIRRGFSVASTQPATMGEQPALVTQYTQVKWMIRFIYARFFTINGDHAYILTYGTADKYFDPDYPTVVSIAASFRFGG